MLRGFHKTTKLGMIFIVCVLMLITLVSSMEWDNVKTYDEEKREYTITNRLGLGSDIAKIRLDSPLNVKVVRGKDRKVAEMTFETFEAYTNVFNDMEFYDLNKDWEELDREFTYKYRTLDGYRNVPYVIGENCVLDLGSKNGSEICEDIIEYEKVPIYSWNELDKEVGLPKGEIKIGIFTDVQPGDSVEWVGKYFGERADAWATWNETFEVNLKAVWNHEEASGELKDVWGGHNGTATGSPLYEQTGINNYCIDYELDDPDYFTIPDHADLDSGDITISVWVKPESNGTTHRRIFASGDQDSSGAYSIYETSANVFTARAEDDSGGKIFATGTKLITAGKWYHVVTVFDTTAKTIKLYVNGSLEATSSVAGDTLSLTLAEDKFIGRDGTVGIQGYDGFIDEVMLWQDVKDLSFVVSLYDSGAGTFYGAIPPPPSGEFNTELLTPADSALSLNTSYNFSVRQNASGMWNNTNVTLYVWDSPTNVLMQNTTSLSGNGSVMASWTNNGFTDGKYNWSAYGCVENQSGFGNCSWSYLGNRSFEVDTTSPAITINKPTTSQDFVYVNYTETINFSITDENFDDSIYEYSGTNYSSGNEEEETTFNLSSGVQEVIVWANDTVGNENSAKKSWSYKVFRNSETYDSSVTEGYYAYFEINVTINSTEFPFVTGKLNYNNTDYSATKTSYGNNHIFSKNLTVPAVDTSTNVSFKWVFSLSNATGTYYVNATTYNQSVSVINASILGSPYTTNFINFTIYDQETLEQVDSTFAITLNYGVTSLVKSLSYENSDINQNLSSYSFGFDPAWGTFLIEGTIEYSSPGYGTTLYTIPEQFITNTTTSFDLHLLNSSDSTSFIIYVRDSTYADVQGAVVYVQRYYAGTDTWTTTEILTTNDDGKCIGHFVSEEANYRFLVYENGILKLTSTPTKIFCETSPCTVTLTLPGSSELIQYGNISGLVFSFDYSKTTNQFTYTYSDSNSSAAGGRLLIIKSNFGNATEITICDNTSAAISGVLICDISSQKNGTFYGFAYNIRETSRLVGTEIATKVKDIVTNIGLSGIIWAVFLLIGIIMVGLFKPIIAIIFTIFSLIVISVLGIVALPWTSVIAIMMVGIILLWEMKS